MDEILEHKVQKQKNHQQAGVSLVELLLVLAILGIVSGIGVTYLNLNNTAVKNAAINLKNDLRLARSEAITRNRETTFQVGNATYYNATTSNSNQLLFEHKLKQRVQISPNPQTLSFSPLGNADNCTFNVKGVNKEYKININSVGNVEIE